jgi:hypothetical protein
MKKQRKQEARVRTVVALTEAQRDALNSISEAEFIPVTVLIRMAIDKFLAEREMFRNLNKKS